MSSRRWGPVSYTHLFLLSIGTGETARLLAANNSQPPMSVMVNTTRTTAQALQDRLEEAGVTARPHPWLSDCLLLSRTGNLEGLEAFQKGLFYVQDPASRLAVLAAGPISGMKVLDCCAAPGGKSLSLIHIYHHAVSELSVWGRALLNGSSGS